jgi:hypothetical protein
VVCDRVEGIGIQRAHGVDTIEPARHRTGQGISLPNGATVPVRK